MTEEPIHHPILDSLEDHTDELKAIKKTVNQIIKKFNDNKKTLTERNIEVMYHVLNDSLQTVSELSINRKEVSMELKDYYKHKFKKTPAMGDKLFNKLYVTIHKPYDDLKNFIWKGIFSIDEHDFPDLN